MSTLAALVDTLHGDTVRVIWANGELTASTLRDAVHALAGRLRATGWSRVASRLDNGPNWLVLDLALRQIDAVHIPLPTFFSTAQVTHALGSSGAQCLVMSAHEPKPHEVDSASGLSLGSTLAAWPLSSTMPPLPAGTACITYTSGTTGTAKGVCLSAASMLAVAASLFDAAAAVNPRRHLCLMPLSTLLENVSGVYAALLSGAEIAVPSLVDVGYTGASGLDIPTLLNCLHRYQPESAILLPQLLLALVCAAEAGHPLPASLRFLAVGGGRVGPTLLARAQALGLPVFEGYGLTECVSVVCLNRPDASRAGSVGRPLPHARVGIVDGEIVVDGERCLGYLGADGPPPGPIATGDLGHIDADGYVFVSGRRSNVFITSFGRNVSPEWVESELLQHPAFAQAVVTGEARPFNVAVVWPRRADGDDALIREALAEVNAKLPDYARVADFVRAERPFSAADGLLTSNGRLRRGAILDHYAGAIDPLYRHAAIPLHPVFESAP